MSSVATLASPALPGVTTVAVMTSLSGSIAAVAPEHPFHHLARHGLNLVIGIDVLSGTGRRPSSASRGNNTDVISWRDATPAT
jgi:hypothetical protein